MAQVPEQALEPEAMALAAHQEPVQRVLELGLELELERAQGLGRAAQVQRLELAWALALEPGLWAQVPGLGQELGRARVLEPVQRLAGHTAKVQYMTERPAVAVEVQPPGQLQKSVQALALEA